MSLVADVTKVLIHEIHNLVHKARVKSDESLGKIKSTEGNDYDRGRSKNPNT